MAGVDRPTSARCQKNQGAVRELRSERSGASGVGDVAGVPTTTTADSAESATPSRNSGAATRAGAAAGAAPSERAASASHAARGDARCRYETATYAGAGSRRMASRVMMPTVPNPVAAAAKRSGWWARDTRVR